MRRQRQPAPFLRTQRLGVGGRPLLLWELLGRPLADTLLASAQPCTLELKSLHPSPYTALISPQRVEKIEHPAPYLPYTHRLDWNANTPLIPRTHRPARQEDRA